MRVVFMGTPQFAVEILGALCERHDVIAVYTRPDAIRARGKALIPTKVKQWSLSHDISVYTPKTLRDESVIKNLSALSPDCICVAAYGMLLPPKVLSLPRYGCLNVHASLLPRWRGAAPIERAILAGDRKIGVSIMRMEEGLDTGPFCECRTIDADGLSLSDITELLSRHGAEALLCSLDRLLDGSIEWHLQDEASVTYADKLRKNELFITPRDSQSEAVHKFLASSDAHPCRCCIGGKHLRIISLSPQSTTKLDDIDFESLNSSDYAGSAAGVVCIHHKRLFLGVSDGFVEILAVKPDGKRCMDAISFASGIHGIKQGCVRWEEIGED